MRTIAAPLLPVLFLFLSLACTAARAAECGDVVGGGDGIKTSDALAVLREAVGLDSNLTCVAPASQYSRMRVYGFDGCSRTTFRASTGETMAADEGKYSAYVEFPRDSVQWVEVTACGVTDRFDGPFTIPRERLLSVEVLLLDPIWLGYTCDDIVTYITMIDEGPRPGGNL